MPAVLITSTSFGKKIREPLEILQKKGYSLKFNNLNRPLAPQELIDRLIGCEGCIAGLDHFTAEVFRASPRLRVIARYGAGVDRIDLKAAAAAGVTVTNTPEANSDSVADLAVGLMLAAARKIPAADRLVRAGRWENVYGLALAGKTVGILGFGRIGRRVARRLQGFDCRLLVVDPLVSLDAMRAAGAEPVALEELLRRSDFVTLHLPVNDQTRGILGAAELAKMKPTAILVNTARGELVDQGALVEALRSGRLRGAGLDVYAQEPPDPNLFEGMESVVLTPHMGSYTDEALANMGMGAVENLVAVLEGRRPPNPVVLPEVKAP